MGLNVNKIREDFEILKNDKLIYFDNSCMTLRPRQVIDAMDEYYKQYPACALRSHHKLARLATEKVEESRKNIQKFVGAKKSQEIIFTKNTTESINLVANSFGLKKGDQVLTTDKEHNSNNIPWLVLQKKIGIKRNIILSNQDNTFSIENFKNLMTKEIKLVSVVHTSNLDGVTTPIKEIIKISHDYGAKVLVDGAQSIPHKEVDVKKLDIDFLAFSAHKMLGPSGMGALYGKEELLNQMDQYVVGGETVIDSTYDTYAAEKIPEKYEAGLQNYAGIIGFSQATKYLDKIGRDNIEKHENELNRYISENLLKDPKIMIIGPKDAKLRGGIFSFNIKGLDPHLVAQMLDANANIAIRSGAHCVHCWFNAKKLNGSARASLYAYNTIDEAQTFVEKVKEISRLAK